MDIIAGIAFGIDTMDILVVGVVGVVALILALRNGP